MINVLWVATLFCWSMKFKRAHHVGHVAQVLRLWNLHVANAIPGSHPGSSFEDVGVKNCGINQLGKHHCKPKSPGHANPLLSCFLGVFPFKNFLLSQLICLPHQSRWCSYSMCTVVKLTCGKGFHSKDDLTERKMSHWALLKYFNFNLTTMFTCQINHRPRQRKESIFVL